MLGGERGRCCGGAFEMETWRGERVSRNASYKPFIFFGGIAVSALTKKKHMSTIISGCIK